jgi:hypothetical protein
MNQTLRVVTGELDPHVDRGQKNVRFVAYVMDQNNAAVTGATITLTLIDGLGNSVGPISATAGSGAIGTSLTPLGSYYVDQDLTATLIGPAQLIGTWAATSGSLTAACSFSTQIIDSLDRTF